MMTTTNTTTYTDAYIEYGVARSAVLSADEQWQRELDFQNIDRDSPEASGVFNSGSMLRSLYERKLRADEELRDATDNLKANGTAAEVQAVIELYG